MDQNTAPVFIFHGEPYNTLKEFAHKLADECISHGYNYESKANAPNLVLNFTNKNIPAIYRRKSQATFVISIMELHDDPKQPIQALYPYLVRSLSNMLLAVVPHNKVHFLTLDLGHYIEPNGSEFYKRIFCRIHPIASSVLVVNNRFDQDLPADLWYGDELTQSLSGAGRILDSLNLLPAPFPLQDVLSPEDLRHVNRLYGIGGLSYGNLSVRKDQKRFWMSASGVDKGNMNEIGREILMVKDYDPGLQAMILSVPSNIEPRRVSVDAIEHWMIYKENPSVEAIIHVHAWMEGVPSTLFHYPCGSYQLAEAVAELVRTADDPSCTVVGLRNHGLTITGRSFADIIERTEEKLIRTVPMT